MAARDHSPRPLISSLVTLALATIVTAGATIAAGCGARDDGIFGPGTGGEGGQGASTSDGGGGSGGGPPLPPAKADKVDLLLVIDNSRSMADKQEILSLTIPELLQRFINPLCVDAQGLAVSEQPSNADADCPTGSERLFPPVTDLHVGVVSTSLGGHGADACTGENDPTENDRGQLLTRGPGGPVPTWSDKDFLAWDPLGDKTPPGTSNVAQFESNLKALIIGTGQLGCGFEASLESWYRFLVDPQPYETITVENSSAVLDGVDQVILEQRRNFLRPDSLLSIVMLSDENDCSIRDGGQFYFAAQIFQPGTTSLYHLPKPRAACEDDPYDPCCRSCGQNPGDGCSTAQDECSGALDNLADNVNLRCWDQKRRFGIDFTWPVDRYVSGLTDPQVTDRFGNVVPNPIFSDLDPTDELTKVRDERLVYLTALVGVPWQDLARQDGSGNPDLVSGLDGEGRPIGAFQNGKELADNGTWNIVLGNPMTYVTSPGTLPSDPLMRESVEPRSGTHPILGSPVAPPGASYDANPINGHEYSIPLRDDLQYSCVFPLFVPRDCSNPYLTACDCADPGNDDPLCQDETTDQFGTTQYRAKAYPGLRHLEVLRDLGARGVAGSICPAQLEDPNSPDFGYVPTVRTLVREVAPALDESE